ncbi:restriction endonuclease type II-like protein [Microdochium trichocladiopsis]|uniref:Restriction endonuclease type II-like protein n=1 Tax=Microdochium trichocladiopsis TaxID=1682393 RepID=A0A9P9C075_9PEZI|nr:restriction endonuclease type II-like protein [Microdochium trichocladiopsis]KAH7040844.1 restriction endonuclease type II-like protein [Microdochium trichocladiopsis]
MDDDDFGADADFLSALASSAPATGSSQAPSQPRIQQPTPQRIQQPTPQRLDRAPPTSASANGAAKIVQPTPQALPQRSSGSSILVSPRQKGNPVLASLRSVAWEYSDIPADYGLGQTTCALFLSLKYHRLHPEYIYTRIRNLQGRYNLRIVLTMVDIQNHEDSLRELSKTSLINNVTVILCWSAAEAARYLELYKSYEHANFAAIKGQQATGYAERLVEFVTVPRGINKADSISLVSAFGSLKNAVNADPEQVSVIGGWGEKKVNKWCSVVAEPFRVERAAKRTLERGDSSTMDVAVPLSTVPLRDMPRAIAAKNQALSRAVTRENTQASDKPAQHHIWDPDEDDDQDDEAAIAAAIAESMKTVEQDRPATTASAKPPSEDQLNDGVAAALARLRQGG